MSRRKTVKVDKSVSEIIEKMLKGNVVEVEDGKLARKVCQKLHHLRTRDLLYNAYNQSERKSYLWLDESVTRDMLKKRKKSDFGDIWDIVSGMFRR